MINRYLFRITCLILISLTIGSCASRKKPVAPTSPNTATADTTAAINTTNAGATGKIQTINPEQFNKLLLLDEIQLVDVRTKEEYQVGHIKDALNIDVKDPNFKTNISKLDKNKPVLVYCRSGKRSGDAAEILRGMGFTKIVSLEGGMLSWEEADLPINK